jgi:PHD/YefM family antitoxin component YafN of YafNO toxin-antitoxin module
MKTTTVSKLRTSVASHVFDELKSGSDEPIAVLSSSEIIGYLVSAAAWDALQAQLKRLRARNRELYEDLLQAAEDQQPEAFDLDAFLADQGLTRSDAR